jgi:putative DNA primase/helicase
MASFDDGIDLEGTTPRLFEDILIDANALSKDSHPDDIQRLAFETQPLSPLQRRRVFETIKRNTGTPFGVLEEALKSDSASNSDDHLAMARRVIEKIGVENITASQGFVWQWNDSGLWIKLEKRAVKQIVQSIIACEIDGVSKQIVESICDLLETEIFNKDQEFNVGHADCINCKNGELSLIDGEWQLLLHKREHYRTTQIPVTHDVNATAPRFMRFLDEVFAGDPDKEDKEKALLEMIGYSLMAHCKYERFIILVGTGANGKSVLLFVLESLIGGENISGVQPSTFDRAFHRAHLHGKLANIVTEIKQGEVIDDASLKGIVSGEPTTVEHKFGHPFVMRPFATCWFGTNHMPHTRDFSDALFRRALILKFNNVFKPELGNCDPHLRDELTRELPGILNMALNAYTQAIINGFTIPQSCIEARDEWRIEADQVAQFIDAECVRNDNEEVRAQLLYEAYREWSRASGVHQALTIKTFRCRLDILGFGTRRTSEARYVTGLSCAKSAEMVFKILTDK